MPSKRRTTRTTQLHPQPAPRSDYDTDTANVTDAPPADLAPPPIRTNTELNLTVLRRYSPDVEHIVAIAPFAVIYTFSPETQGWEKCGIEGTLFICQLNAGRYNVVVLNRKSLDNFIEELASPDDIEVNEPFIILQIAGEDDLPQIFGLWIFSEPDDQPSTRDVVAQTLQSCARQAQIAHGGTYGQTRDEPETVEDQEEALYDNDEAAYMPPTQHAAPEEPPQQPKTQQIDLLSLFGKPGAQPGGQPIQAITHPMHVASQPAATPAHSLPPRSTSTGDTDFFRNTQSAAAGLQQQPRAPSVQQNALLNLFKK